MEDEHESLWRCWRTCGPWPIAVARILNPRARFHPAGPVLRTIHGAVAHGWSARTFRHQGPRPPRGNGGSPTRSDLLPRPRPQAVLPAPGLDSRACSTRSPRLAVNRAKYFSRIFSFVVAVFVPPSHLGPPPPSRENSPLARKNLVLIKNAAEQFPPTLLLLPAQPPLLFLFC